MGLLVLLMMIGAFSNAPIASAHASLISTSPTDGAELESSPTEIVLEFSEPVGSVDGGFVLHGPSGDALAIEPETSGSTVTLPLTDQLGDGSYILQWRVISSDSHPIAGTVSFVVGDAGAGVSIDVDETLPSWVENVRATATAIKYLGLLGAFGVVFVGWCIARSDSAIALRTAIPFAVAGLIGTITELPFAGMIQQGSVPGDATEMWSSIRSLPDDVLGAAAVSSICLIAFLFAGPLKAGWSTHATLASVAFIPLVFSGHSRSREPIWLMMASDTVHIVAGGMWLGGIVLLTLMLIGRWPGRRASSPEGVLVAVSRFSSLAIYIAVAMAATGVIMAIVILDDVKALWETAYGITLMVKVGLTLVILGIAALNRYWLLPQRKSGGATTIPWLRRLVTAELVLLIAIIGVTGSLVQRDPQVVAQESFTKTVVYNNEVALDNTHTALVSVEQTGERRVAVEVTITDETGETLVPDSDLSLDWYLPERDLGPIQYEVAIDPDTGMYTAELSLPMNGTWEVEMRVQIDRFTDSRATIEVQLED